MTQSIKQRTDNSAFLGARFGHDADYDVPAPPRPHRLHRACYYCLRHSRSDFAFLGRHAWHNGRGVVWKDYCEQP